MKKTKTYEVSVINKTYSKTYSDQTKFYTSDTALELNFQLKEVEYDFDSAEIILLNVDDRSLVTRPVAKSAEGFIYELEDDIVTHYGEWKGQLKFNEGGEIYVSSPVGFRIENDLDNDMPPQLTEVNTWKNLRAIADGLIADIRSELESVAVKVSEMELAETQRASAESSRVSAEEQREIDHANRSAELARKADKVVLENLIENGDFSDGFNGWIKVSPMDTYIIDAGIISINNSNTGSGIAQGASNYRSGKYYISARYSGMRINIRFRVGLGGSSRVMEYLPNSENMTTYSVISELAHDDVDTLMVVSQDVLSPYKVDTLSIINLTQTFGAGNEPTKEEMDELIKVTGHIDGEYLLNNKDIMGHLMKGIREKADKKQEDWITLPLYNGAQHGASPLKVMKDEMGVVHFKGSLTNLVSGDKVFSLPSGYRPDIGTTESYIRVPVALNSGREMNAVQINYVGDGYIFNPSSTTIAFFDAISYLAKRG